MYVSYSIEIRTAYHDSYRYYKNISPDEIKYAAQCLGYKGKGLDKLINHTSMKFTYVKTNDLFIDKHFHESQPEYDSFLSQDSRNQEAFKKIHNL